MNIPPGHNIQPMTVDDLDDIVKIESRSFPNPWTRGLFESELKNPVSFSYTLKLNEGGKEVLAAYIIFWIVLGEAHILNLCVDQGYRNTGLATELLDIALDIMRKNMAFEVFLEVRKSNKIAQRLYASFGFRQLFERKNYYGDEDAIVMSKDL